MKQINVCVGGSGSIIILENVEHCGGEPEQADTGYYVTDE